MIPVPEMPAAPLPTDEQQAIDSAPHQLLIGARPTRMSMVAQIAGHRSRAAFFGPAQASLVHASVGLVVERRIEQSGLQALLRSTGLHVSRG